MLTHRDCLLAIGAAQREARSSGFIMTGVELDPSDGGACATDGHALVRLTPLEKVAAGDEAEIPGIDAYSNGTPIVLPADAAERFAKAVNAAKVRHNPKLGWVQVDTKEKRIGVHDGAPLVASFAEPAGRFPNWKRVLPDGNPDATAWFDPALLVRVLQIAVKAGVQSVALNFRADSASDAREGAERFGSKPVDILGKGENTSFRALCMPMFPPDGSAPKRTKRGRR